ncbi:hypothetical protein, partial [Burkholderia vietnamiensis]|uniref:hypothetical protein n=1 Tax=Burkholderia vietnamiensis TaxID=60552 RepID=UPI001ABB9E99
DVDFDDIDAAEIADIWNFDFDETHVRPLLVGYGEREWKLARRTGHGLTREREPGQNHLCCPPKDAPFFWLLFFGRQRKVTAAPRRGDASRPYAKQVQRQ